ncbi:MAG: ABC transporter permease [Firmicutes bacterium]|nr:ABC transporter permease [Bacillota bacterium]
MRTRALTRRILSQLRHDRRTMALVLFAPLLILSLLYFILNGAGATYTIVVGESPEAIVQSLEEQDDLSVRIVGIDGEEWQAPDSDAADGVNADGDSAALKNAVVEQEATGGLSVSEDLKEIHLYLDGTNSGDAAKVSAVVTKALQEEMAAQRDEALSQLPIEIDLEEPEIERTYIYGKEDSNIFDSYGAALIGFIVFFFVFLIAGINFLTERTSGTLEKLLSTPIRRHEIVFGYVAGFSVLALIQTVLVTLFVVYVLDIDVAGSIWYVLLFNLLTAVCALSMGILISSLANSEFQMVQFIPIVVLPQAFLCGIFTLSGGWDIVGHFMPLYYTAHGLQRVILRGAGFADIWQDLAILLGFSLLFLLLTIRYLKRLRSW